MSDATPLDEAMNGLSELAACDLGLAKRFATRIHACGDDDDEKAMDLARSYQRMARSYRQTLIIQARLRRELKVEAKQDAVDAGVVRRERTANLRAAIRADVKPQIWRVEREQERCEELDGILDELIDEAAAGLDFLDLTPQAHAQAMLDVLRLDEEEDADAEDADAEDADDDSAPPIPSPILFNGRLAPPRDVPAWMTDEDSS